VRPAPRAIGPALLLALLVGPAEQPAGEAPPAAEAPAEITLPLTIENVWFTRKSGAPFRFSPSSGDLTIRDDVLTFSTRKRAHEIPVQRLRVVSFGKTPGDVDTDWVLLGIGERRAESVVAIRDGSKFGYGQRSREIFETLKAALKTLRAAQYDVADGFRAYDVFDEQFTFAIPEDWAAYVASVTIVDDRAPWGRVLVSQEAIPREREPGEPGPGPVADPRVLERVLAGRVPAFFVERRAVEPGMACAGFSRKGTARLLGLAAEGRLFPGGGRLAAAPDVSPELVDRCQGLRLRSRVVGDDGTSAELDLHAIARGDTLFVFGLRAVPDRYEEFRRTLDACLSTVRFSIAE